jgi:putative transposase
VHNPTITYIRLRTEFVFLAVVIDRYSRKAIGWALNRSLTARVAVTALQQAIGQRQPPPGVVHHSDLATQIQRPQTKSGNAWSVCCSLT